MRFRLVRPDRRRRRVAIAVALIGFGWWLWTREDSRFVGTWKLNAYSMHMEFHRDGTVILHQNDGRQETLRWHVEGDQLYFGEKPYWIVPEPARSSLRTVLDDQSWAPQPSWTITDVHPDLIELRLDNHRPANWMLTRIE